MAFSRATFYIRVPTALMALFYLWSIMVIGFFVVLLFSIDNIAAGIHHGDKVGESEIEESAP